MFTHFAGNVAVGSFAKLTPMMFMTLIGSSFTVFPATKASRD